MMRDSRKIEGSATADLLAGVALPMGKLEMGAYNLSVRNYETHYMQANQATKRSIRLDRIG